MSILSELGLTVARSLPPETLSGLASGAYKLYGGVVRNAGGQIVSHLVASNATQSLTGLIPGASLISHVLAQGQLWKLGKDVAQVQSTLNTVLSVSMTGTALSGLGLVTSIASVAYLSHRFDQVDAKLASLESDVKDIKGFLNNIEKSKLEFAIDNVRHSETTTDEALRYDMLLQSKREFSTLAHLYKAEWARCRNVVEISAVDDLYVLAILGSATVCSNLGMRSEAAIDLRSHVADYSAQARLHARKLLFNDRPDRLLGAEYVEHLPARTLVALLDYASDSDRGVDWLDDLRLQYGKNATVLETLSPIAPARLQRLLGKNQATGAAAIGLAQSLRTRSEILNANTAHYDFLSEKGVSASAFQLELESARTEIGTEAICVYASGDLVPQL